MRILEGIGVPGKIELSPEEIQKAEDASKAEQLKENTARVLLRKVMALGKRNS